MHENNLQVHAYTINNKSDKEYAKSINVDGYFTNFPD
ncbi:hypothetical protein CW664_00225 [Macrococcoides caseolyticum]|nr:hypothetical protein CW664_00225 [Macrococcus caseolyticus]